MAGRPKCPDAHPTVEMIPTGDKRIWICQISSARFEVSIDDQEADAKVDKFGNKIIKYKITPIDGGEK